MMSACSVDRGLQNLLRRHHDAEIDHVVVVALEHDADDVLADVVHVALDCGEHDLAVRRGVRASVAVLLHERHQMGDGLLHHARRLDHLRQEHPSRAEQIADDVHAVHQRAFDHRERARRFLARLLHVVGDEIGDAVDQRMRQALFHRPFAPGKISFLLFLAGPAVLLRQSPAAAPPHRRGD